MDAPLDFRLDRNRILSSGLTSGNFANYDAAYAESSRVSALNRNTSGSIPDLARIGTPASLSQFPSRYFHHSVGAQGSPYPLVGSYLPGAVPTSEHVKSLLPEDYWASHGLDGTRYVLNNNLYPPYFPYLPATESLSLFAHNLSSGGVDQTGYHRIYDLRKDAGLYSGLQMSSPPSTRPNSSQNEATSKKDSSRTDSKRSESGKHSTKIQESVSKVHASQKASKDSEKRSEPKKLEKSQTVSNKSTLSSYKNSSSKKDKVTKTDDKSIDRLDEKVKHIKHETPKTTPVNEDKSEKCDVHMTDKKSNSDKESKDSKETEDDSPEKDNKNDSPEKSNQKTEPKNSSVECKGTSVITMTTVTSSSSVVSILDSPTGSSQLKPIAATDPFKATTATTFSLPYYHSLFSTSHSILTSPLVGSTTSTASMCSEPVQTVPCDMRIKKEPAVYTCSSLIETKTTQSSKKQQVDSNLCQDGNSESKIDKLKEITKPKLASPICSVATSTSKVMPLCLKKHILEKSKEWRADDSPSNIASKQESNNVTKNIPEKNACDTKPNETANSNGCEDDKVLSDLKHRHSKEIQQLTTTSKDTVKAISKVLSKRQESSESLKSNTDNSRMLTSPRKPEPKLPVKRVLIKPKCDDKKTAGVSNIPIGIAVARKREDLKKDESDDVGGDTRDGGDSSNGSSNSNSSQDRTIEPSSSSTKSISNVNVVDMRSQLPANLIVTGSATGAGIAWSDDPTARHFPTQWLQTPHQLNQSWIGQLPFQMPPSIPTSSTDQTLPITIPPGYKIAQDSVTGQLVMIPSTDIEIYDPSRIWNSFAANPPTMLATHPSHQLLQHSQDRTMPFVVQPYQHLLQNRQENILPSESLQNQNIQVTSGSIKNKVTKDTTTTKTTRGSEKKMKSVGMVTPQVSSTDLTTSAQTLPYSYSGPVPLIVNPSLTSNISVPCSEKTVKTETSMVQSRGTSPMVPASEIEDASQEMIDNSPVPDKQDGDVCVIRKDTVTDDDESSFSSTDSFINERTSITDIDSKVDSNLVQKDNKESAKESEEVKSVPECESVLNKDITVCDNLHSVEQNVEMDKEPEQLKTASKTEHSINLNKTDEKLNEIDVKLKSGSLTEKVTSELSEKVDKPTDEYNPFLDPQILQAVDGLELLSALAEKRSKSLDTNAEPKKEDIKQEKEEEEENDERKPEDKPKPAKRAKVKRTISRTRSIPPVKEPETPSYYTSTGLRIPQDLHSFLDIGEEEINAIELDMRIRLAELQRQYKEKQKQLSKLQPKKEKETPKDTKDKDSGDAKRGPGRPKKKLVSCPNSDTSEKKLSPKSKDGSVKKKKPAEELVDRVFRKTGGGFGMPLSKKLKANAMAALFKTQSGFTVKRKGSTSSLMLTGKSFTSSEKSVKTKKHKVSSPDSKESSCTAKSKDTGDDGKTSSKVKKIKEEHKDDSVKKWKDNGQKDKEKDDSLQSGLGLLAKYATNALKQHMSTKKAKRKRSEGSCSEQTTENVTNGDEDTTINNETNNNATCSPASSIKVEESEKKPEIGSPEVKKRKPGRPRKGTPTRTTGVTETLVAKTSKNFQLFQYQSFQDLAKKNKDKDETERKPKIESESPMKPLFLDEEWLLRRSERIFLSDPSPQASPNYSQPPKTNVPKIKSEQKSKSDQAKLQKAKNMKELTQRVKRKYKKSMEKRSSHKAREKKTDHIVQQITTKQAEQKKNRSKSVDVKPPQVTYDDDSSESEGDNIPLSLLKERPTTPSQRTCVLSEEDLKEGLNVLVFKDSLFHEGTVQPIHPPDIYGVLIQNERGNRPHIYSREEILKEVILDLRPESVKFMPEGTRICAYWSQQFNCLYPGTVSRGSPNSSPDIRFINVEFDDGDSGKIPLDHIRLLPSDFPLVSYDPNPLLLIGKRRRHTTSDISEPRKSVSSIVSECTPKVKRGPGRPPKIKQEDVSFSEMTSEDEQDIDVCGFDDSETDTDKDDTDNVFSSQYSQKYSKHHSAKRKHKSDNDKDEKVKKKKVSTDDKKKDRNVFEDQAFMPPRQWWRWYGKSTKRPGMKGKAKKEFYKEIIRGREAIKVGDCAVFVSTGRPHLPYIGRIDSMWESWGGQMTVKVKWFYHPEETRGGKKLQDMKRALFQSPHFDENDVQTISHKCEVISYTEYRRGNFDKLDSSDVYYLAGTYEPTIGLLKFEPDIM